MIDRTLRRTRSTFDIYHSSYPYSGAAYTWQVEKAEGSLIAGKALTWSHDG